MSTRTRAQHRACAQSHRRALKGWSWLWLAVAVMSCQRPGPTTPIPTPTKPVPAISASQPFTASPQPDLTPTTGTDVCGAPDAGLRRVAQVALVDYTKSERLPSSEALTFALKSEGVPYVWVRSWAATGADPEAIQKELQTWATARPRVARPRCGLARSTTAGVIRALAVVADGLADVSPVPRQARVGQWLPFEAQLHVEATQLTLLALGPHGAPYKLPVQVSGDGRVRGQLPLATPGRWLFQLLPTTVTGPRPVAEVEVFVDIALPPTAEEQLVPGDAQDCATGPCGPSRLVSMLNQARTSERLPPLAKDPRLDALASEHAAAMLARSELAHDAGAGDAYIRVSPTFPDASLIGENIAHASNLRAAHRALWLSPAHRHNLLRREYTDVGVGVAYDAEGDVWVCQLFAAQTPPPASY